MDKQRRKMTRLVLGPRQVDRLIIALGYANDVLWPEGEEEPVNRTDYRENAKLAELLRKARDR